MAASHPGSSRSETSTVRARAAAGAAGADGGVLEGGGTARLDPLEPALDLGHDERWRPSGPVIDLAPPRSAKGERLHPVAAGERQVADHRRETEGRVELPLVRHRCRGVDDEPQA